MDFVAITSCPAGLAHTPMAAKALEKAAQEMGLKAKVEQQGAMGLKNEISAEEAENSEFVLIGSDQKIEKMERFTGKTVLRVDINMCIKKPKAVIDKCMKAVAARKNSNS
jgi:PTS system fructose-specific IIB component